MAATPLTAPPTPFCGDGGALLSTPRVESLCRIEAMLERGTSVYIRQNGFCTVTAGEPVREKPVSQNELARTPVG